MYKNQAMSLKEFFKRFVREMEHGLYNLDSVRWLDRGDYYSVRVLKEWSDVTSSLVDAFFEPDEERVLEDKFSRVSDGSGVVQEFRELCLNISDTFGNQVGNPGFYYEIQQAIRLYERIQEDFMKAVDA